MDFVTIDFETANYSRKSACALGMVKYNNRVKTDTFYSLIRPPSLYIRPDFTAIHGLTTEDVQDAPTFEELWGSGIYPFIGDLPIAAHNAHFDMGVLLTTLKWYEISHPVFRYFCSLQLARHAWILLESHALQALAKEFNIRYKAHNALDDAETCGQIILLAADKFNVNCVDDLLGAANIIMKEKR